MPGPFKAPLFNRQIKRDAHDDPPTCLPALTAGYSEVREFIYAVMTLRCHGVCIEHPDIVRRAVDAWIGSGGVLHDKVKNATPEYCFDLDQVIPHHYKTFDAEKSAQKAFSREVISIYRKGGHAADGVRFDHGKEKRNSTPQESQNDERTPPNAPKLSALVIDDYKAKDDNEMCLTAGERVEEILKYDEHWWFGCKPSGESGFFPPECVKATSAKEETEEKSWLSKIWRRSRVDSPETGSGELIDAAEGSAPPPYSRESVDNKKAKRASKSRHDGSTNALLTQPYDTTTAAQNWVVPSMADNSHYRDDPTSANTTTNDIGDSAAAWYDNGSSATNDVGASSSNDYSTTSCSFDATSASASYSYNT